MHRFETVNFLDSSSLDVSEAASQETEEGEKQSPMKLKAKKSNLGLNEFVTVDRRRVLTLDQVIDLRRKLASHKLATQRMEKYAGIWQDFRSF